MHGNHQNWKGNKGVPEGAPLSLHGGCLATPASRSLPAPTLLTPSALTPSQPFPPNHRRSPRRALRYPLHFFLLSSLSAAHHSRIRTAEYRCSLFLPSCDPPPSHALPSLSTSIRLFSLSLSFPFGDVPPKEPPGGFLPPPRKLRFLALLPHLQLARMYPPLRQASLTFRTFSVHPCI